MFVPSLPWQNDAFYIKTAQKWRFLPDQPARRLHRTAQSSVAQPRPVGAVAVRGHFADVRLRQQRDLEILLLAAGRVGGQAGSMPRDTTSSGN
eukprot:COSAG06_NODE_11925_length_1446_cov_2.002970_1_plen_93_part_00